MGKLMWFLIILGILILGVIGYVAVVMFGLGSSGGGYDGPEIDITYDNFEEQMMRQSLVHDIPKDGIIKLSFYNFDSGDREIEESYVLTKGNVVKGSEAGDIEIQIHSKYLAELTNKNFCSVVPSAKANGDMITDSKLSTSKLSWKYKGMFKYRDCLGF